MKEPQKVLIRVDANKKIGFGHLYRCLTLANILIPIYDVSIHIKNDDRRVIQLVEDSNPEIEIQFAISEEHLLNHINQFQPIVVLDGYHFTNILQQKIKNTGAKLVCIDDIHNQHFFCDALINFSPAANQVKYESEEYTKLYLGMRYALLRAEFINYSSSFNHELANNSVFISMGGSDPGKFTIEIVSQIIKEHPSYHINVLITDSFEDKAKILSIAEENDRIQVFKNLSAAELISVMNQSSICITAASTIALETIMINRPLVVIKTADNQASNFEFLTEFGAAISYQDWINSKRVDTQSMIERQNQLKGNNQKENIKEIFKSLH